MRFLRRYAPSLVLFLFLGAGAGAQSYLVHPSQYKTLEGESAFSYPFSYSPTSATYRQMIFQQVHDNLSQAPLPLKGIAFRRDASVLYFWPAWSAVLELVVAHAPQGVNSQNMTKTFASNLGKDQTVVIAKKKIQFPPSVGKGAFPRPFVFNLVFDRGKVFLYKGGGRSLTWLLRVFDNDLHTTVGSYVSLDRAYYYQSSMSISGAYVPIGQGGFAPRQYRSMYSSFYPRLDKKSSPRMIVIDPYISAGPRGGKAVALLSRLRFRQGLPIGAGGGRLWLNPGTIFFVSSLVDLDYWGNSGKGLVGPGGKRVSLINLPDNPAIYGVHLFGQMVAVDTKTLSLYFPNACEVQLPYDPARTGGVPMGTTYYRGSVTRTTGYGPYKSQGLVVRFAW